MDFSSQLMGNNSLAGRLLAASRLMLPTPFHKVRRTGTTVTLVLSTKQGNKKMDKIPKLGSGKEIPVIGFGVYLIPAEDTARAVKQALEIGYRHIDSASCYKNEAECAEGIVNFLDENRHVKRSDIFYTTKI